MLNRFKVSSALIMSGSFYVYFSLCLLFAVAVSTEDCDKTQCKGPLRYYEEIGCKPVYENPNSCCAIRYDCSHLNERSADKCYANGQEYEIGEELKNKDRSSPCDIGCRCLRGYRNDAKFTCAVVDCFNRHFIKPGCYFKRKPDSCCGGEEVCSKSEDRFTCEIQGKVYRDGEAFYPEKDSGLVCQCMEGYKGENVYPFCRKVTCGVELRHNSDIRENCVPVFYSSQTPRTSCSLFYRCQNNNDTVIHSANKKNTEGESDDMKCKFGNMSMHIGDELNQSTDYSSVCVKCACEVPPVLTCQRLPDNECDVTIHPKFT